MRCPKCGYEPRHRLLSRPCPNPECKYIWVDSEDYVRLLCDPIPNIKTVVDIGCGMKGMIAQAYWDVDRAIQRGYACDIHVLKPMPSHWVPLVMDAEGLVEKLGHKSIDVVTHCGMLEHVEYAKALRILHVIEQIAVKKVFMTCSAVCREVDRKVKADGNPYHYYRSFWDGDVLEALGYTVDRERMIGRLTFLEEVTAWYDPADLGPWKPREERAIQLLTDRRCCGADKETTVSGLTEVCPAEPVWWDPRARDGKGGSFCFRHAEERNKTHGLEAAAPIKRWYDDPSKLKDFPWPPWRKRRPLFPEEKQ
jgi:hypothetical protein